MLRQREPRIRIQKILDAAKNEDCTVQHDHFCNGDSRTVVAAHPNWLDTGKGVGIKTDDLLVCFACGGCHDFLDGRTHPPIPEEERRFYWLRGHCKTLRRLWERGVIK
jgi:hypothetical protein